MLSNYSTLSIVSGWYWAIVAYWWGHSAIPTFIWGGMLASPFIGWLVGRLYRPACAAPLVGRLVLSLATLYLAAGLFGAAAGFADLLRPAGQRIASAVVLQAVFGAWWGLTFTGAIIVLWPLSFANHELLCRGAKSA